MMRGQKHAIRIPRNYLLYGKSGWGSIGVIWSEKWWTPACSAVENRLFSRLFLVKFSAFNAVRGQAGVREWMMCFGPLRLAVLWTIVLGKSVIFCKWSGLYDLARTTKSSRS